MKKVILVVCLLFLVTGCASNKIVVRSLDSLIIESATKAKTAGAKDLKIETSVLTGVSANASLPISVVAVGASTKLDYTTTLTVTIDLSTWQVPAHNKNASKAADVFLLDTTYNVLEDIPPVKAAAK
jgi:hypothetical protein